jgi:hypothetical protein
MLIHEENFQRALEDARKDSDTFQALAAEIIGTINYLTTQLLLCIPDVTKKQDLHAEEIMDLYTEWRSCQDLYPIQVVPAIAPLSVAIMADAFALVENRDAKVTACFFNPRDYADLRKFGRDVLDIELREKYREMGWESVLWGARVISNPDVPQGKIYVMGKRRDTDENVLSIITVVRG